MKKKGAEKAEKQTPLEQLTEKPKEFLIVGIGASAGGIQALQEFFRQVPEDSDMAYVVILHLSPDHDSQLASVLQRETKIPVAQVTEKTVIKPNHIYVVPPDRHLTMEDGYIAVSPNLHMEERRAPVDIFFRTLADRHGPRAIAVVLSGTGANGSMGLKRIKERGGATFVQNPREAEFNEMPRNAIATGLVDEVLNVADIPVKIIAYKTSMATVQIALEADQHPEDQQHALREVFTLLRQRTGHDFSNYKRPTLLRRIERRINVRSLPSLPAYANFLQENAEEATALLKDLLISVTNFFRDKKAFEVVEQEIIPLALKGKKSEDQVRIWVAGCATGEEAYSLAMLCLERTLGVIDAPRVQIFATDIDEMTIAQAREGFYTLNDLADVSPERLLRFFNKEGDGYRVRREVREMVMFALHNFLKDPPFSHLDLVSCRNVIIYLNGIAQERAMETFHFALNPGGFLFLGNSESVDGTGNLYAAYNRDYHIFQSRHVGPRMYPLPDSVPPLYLGKPKQEYFSRQQVNKAQEQISFGDLHQQLLEEYAPPSLVVNEEYDIVHLTEKAGKYLQIGGGEPSNNLLKLVKPELRLELRSALYQAVQRQSPVATKGLKLTVNNRTETVNIHVRPVLKAGDTARGFTLVLFEPATEEGRQDVLLASDEPVARQLEEELTRMRLQLRASNEQHESQEEELKASNEELQAINEELRSAAEELETSKEELQSINEELRTVNQELKVKIEETGIASNNLRNLINSTDVGTIFLDRSFRVVLFTPAVRAIFNLRPADYGRPLSDITGSLDYDDLVHDAENVLERLVELEKEVRTKAGGFYLMRITPYRTDEDRIKGVVITFLDITERKKIEEAFRIGEGRLQRMVNIPRLGVLTLDQTGFILHVNDAFLQMVGYTRQEFEAQKLTWRDLTPPEHTEASLQIWTNLLETGRGGPYEKEYYCKDGSKIWLMFVAADLGDGTLVEYTVDVSDRRKAEQRLQKVLSIDTVGVIYFDLQGGIHDANAAFERMSGFSKDEFRSGKVRWEAITPPEFMDVTMKARDEYAEKGENTPYEKQHTRPDGSRWWGLFAGRRIAENEYVEFVLDITEKKKAEEAVSRSEAPFRTLTDAIPQVIWTNNAEGKADYFNQRWYEYSGLSYEQSEGLGWQAIVHPADAPAAVEKWKKALAAGEVFDTEYRLRRHDGSYCWFIGRNVPLKDDAGKVTGWFGSATDIENLKKTEEALSQSEARLRITMESATDYAIITVDTERRVEKWSQGATQLFGYTEAEMRGRSADILFTEEDRKAGMPQKEMETARKTGRAADDRWHQRKDGSRFYVNGVMRPIQNSELTGYVKVMRDMTQQQLFTEKLHQLVAERTLELQRSNEDLRQFATIASHDLQEPLRKLKLFASILQKFQKELPEEGKELLSKIHRTSDRMSRLIREVLQFSQIAYGIKELTATDLHQILQDVLTDLDMLLSETGAVVEYENPLPVIEAIPLQMHQLFYNLMTNALKFRNSKKQPVIRIAARALPPDEVQRHPSLSEGTPYIEVAVSDNGIGFDPQFSEQIFQIFERLHSVDEFEGTGVGLALCKKIVENHRGDIYAVSKEGEGASFHLILPVKQ